MSANRTSPTKYTRIEPATPVSEKLDIDYCLPGSPSLDVLRESGYDPKEESEERDPCAVLIANETSRTVRKFVQSLHPLDQKIVIEKYKNDSNQTVIARKLKLSRKTINQRLSNVLNMGRLKLQSLN